MTNREIAQEISARIGTSPIPFESIYSIALEIYNELGGEPTQFDNVYSILLVCSIYHVTYHINYCLIEC